jgi:GNAT superfamily N-acetyltransferase
MNGPWVSNDYRRDDEYRILKLYEEVNGRKMSLDYWRWRYTKSPFGRGIMKLVFVDNKLVGQYAVTPVSILVAGRLRRAVFSLHTMTHPDFQKQGIFTFLAEEVYRKCRSDGYGFVYGFPNENSYYGFTAKLGWIGFGKMSSLEKHLNSNQPSNPENVYEITKFDDRVNVLWDRVKGDYRVIVPRTSDYLNWRFAEHPTVKYAMYVMEAASSELTGYAILKIYERGAEVRGHIIDMLSVNDERVIKGLLHAACNYLVDRGIDNVSCWIPDRCLSARILKSEGFIRKEFDVSFGVRLFEKDDESLKGIEQLDNWHLTMSDVDVF